LGDFLPEFAGERDEAVRLLLQELAALNVWAKDPKQDLDSLLQKNHKVTSERTPMVPDPK
jgi:hypothetical protein